MRQVKWSADTSRSQNSHLKSLGQSPRCRKKEIGMLPLLNYYFHTRARKFTKYVAVYSSEMGFVSFRKKPLSYSHLMVFSLVHSFRSISIETSFSEGTIVSIDLPDRYSSEKTIFLATACTSNVKSFFAQLKD